MKIILSIALHLHAKEYRTMTSGWQGAPYFKRYGWELVSKPAISLQKSWGGYRRTTPVGFSIPTCEMINQNRRVDTRENYRLPVPRSRVTDPLPVP